MAEPFDMEPLDVEEAPRRRASARLAVDAEIGSAAAMREAMDPANQSLADALRLSYRVLQAAMIVLVAMFLVSGIQLVRQGQGGVMTRFGKNVFVEGSAALQPGRRWSVLPYPAGDFMIVDVDNRSVSAGGAFWPRIPQGTTLDQAIERARTSAGLRPGDDGSVITAGGDLAHLQVTARFKIADPVGFATSLRDGDADRVVRLALQRAVVEVCARSTLQEIVELSDDLKRRIQQSGQDILDGLNCGIELEEVDLPDTKPPFAIAKAYGDLRNAREDALRRVASAQSAAQTTLDKTTANHAELSRLIDAYEQAGDLGDAQQAARQLAVVNAALESGETTGDVAFVIGRAKAYESEIDSTLGNEASRFRGVLAAYRRNPELEIKRRWIETYSGVLGRDDVEVFHVPADVERLSVNVRGLEAVEKLRSEHRINRLKAESLKESMSLLQKKLYHETAGQSKPGEARPMLEVIDGKVMPRGSGD